MPNPETIRRRPHNKATNGEIPLKWMKFGLEMFRNGGNATDAYKKVFPNAKCCDDAIRWKAYRLKKKLQETNWFHEQLDLAGVSNEKIASVINELLSAKETRFFQKDGRVIETRDVVNHTARAAGAKLALEAKKLLIQKTEVDANVSGNIPTTFIGWLRKETESANEASEETEAGDSADDS